MAKAKNYDKMKKEEIIDELEETKKKLQQALAQPMQIGMGVVDGYLITTEQPYTGVTAGVHFRNGRAFIEAVPRPAEERPEDLAQEEAGVQAAWAKYDEQQALITTMKSDFWYMVTRVDEEGIRKLREEPLGEAMVSETIADKIVMPQVIGGKQ